MSETNLIVELANQAVAIAETIERDQTAAVEKLEAEIKAEQEKTAKAESDLVIEKEKTVGIELKLATAMAMLRICEDWLSTHHRRKARSFPLDDLNGMRKFLGVGREDTPSPPPEKAEKRAKK